MPGVLTAVQAGALQSYILRETETSGSPLFPGMPISDLSTAGFFNNAEISTAPPFPSAAEPWGALPTGGGLGPAAWSLGEGGIKTYVAEINTLMSTMTGPKP